MLSIKKVNKKYKDNQVLDNVELEIGRGELILLTGINGSGKSTLLKIICDITEYDNGEVELEKGLKIGALIENPVFIENKSIKANLKFLADLNKNYNYEHIKNLCQKFSLDIENKVDIKDYSVGMRQKVGIIQAIMENQDLILLDEPVRGLDSDSIKVFIELIKTCISEGKTIMIASHDMLDELPFSRIIKVENGKLNEIQ